MSRVKMIATAALAATALSAMAAGSAFASWFVNGAELKGSARLATTAQVDTNSVTTFPALDIKISCKTPDFGDVEAAEITAPNTVEAKSLIFKGCETLEPKHGCELEGQPATIASVPVKAVVTKGPTALEDRVTLTPQTKSVFAAAPFREENTCVFVGLEPFKGAVTLAMPTGQSESFAQTIVGLGSVENNSLELGTGNKMFLESGRTLPRLASGSKWSFH